MTWSGVCLRAIVSVIPPVSIVGHEYSHSHWTTFRGPNHNAYLCRAHPRFRFFQLHIPNSSPFLGPETVVDEVTVIRTRYRQQIDAAALTGLLAIETDTFVSRKVRTPEVLTFVCCYFTLD